MRVLSLLHRELSPLARYCFALIIFAVALMLRLLALPVDAGMPYVTLYPATACVFYFCGTGPGLLVTALCAFTGYYIFTPPFWSMNHVGGEYFMVCVYLIGALLMALIVYKLQRYADSLHQVLTKLRDSENRFRSFMDNSRFVSWMKDEQGRYVYMNVHLEKRIGIAPGSGLGRTHFELYPADIAAKFSRDDRAVAITQELLVIEESIIGEDGKPRYWLSSKFPYVDSTGQRFVGGIAIDITERKLAEEKVESLAFYDPLTQLPNRRMLLDRIAHSMNSASRHHRLGALLFIDLDNFKTLNDTHGHDQGDLLLQQVAQRLSESLRKGDTLARFGGDEFVVLLEDLSNNALEAAAQAEVVGEKIVAALGQPYPLGGISHRSTPSIGITLFGDTQEAIEEPLRRADLAMYQAKSAGRNTLRFFDPQIQAAITARSLLETDLRAALNQDQFLLYYQPQIKDVGILTGVEALLRWRHPERGMVSPADFIPLAEDTGLILPLGRWVLDTACAQLATWSLQPHTQHLTIAVNVSPRQFHQADFVDQVLDAIAQSGANPQRLKLELTEGLLISNVEDVITKMASLKQKGVGFSLDDFGTGYSSLAYLKRLPLDQLKIDQSFVRDVLHDPNDAAIAKTIIALAESLGLEVIAEGVETDAQRAFLAEHGCNACQGFLFSQPLPSTALETFAARAYELVES